MSRDSLLWQIDFSNTRKSGFILGTIHLPATFAFFRKDDIVRVIQQVDIVVNETEMDRMADPSHRDLMIMPDGLNLRDLLSPKKYNRYHKFVKRYYKMDLDAISHFYPMIILQFLTQSLIQHKESWSVDEFVFQEAQRAEKEYVGIEPYEEQLATFAQIQVSDQLQMLNSAIQSVGKFRKVNAKIFQLYKRERIHSLMKLSKQSLGAYKQLLLYDRNLKMKDRFQDILASRSAIMAVGAAHLSGEKGVLHLLQKDGAKISPI